MKTRKISFLFGLILLMASTACDKGGPTTSANRQWVDRLDFTVDTSDVEREMLYVNTDIVSSMPSEVNAVQTEYPEVDLKRVEVKSVQLISEEVLRMSYMDRIRVYIGKTSDIATTVEEVVNLYQLVGEKEGAQLYQASVTLDITNEDVTQRVADDMNYNVAIVGEFNEQARLLRITPGFESRISFEAIFESPE